MTESERLAAAIVKEAQRIGADPTDFATVISFETGGSFDPWQKGPVTKWKQHIGLIQMGEPQREQFGYYEGMPIEDAVRSSADYLVANGFKPGMSGMDLYSTINAGAPGKYGASDEAAGGTWGTVADKWNHQMADHRKNAEGLLAGTYIPEFNSPYSGEAGQEGSVAVDPLAHLGTDAAAPVDMFTQAEQDAQAPKPYETFFGEVGAAYESTAITAQAVRWLSEDMIDMDFRLEEARGQELMATYPDQYHDMIVGASSEKTLQSRIQWIEEDMVRQERLGAGGGTAVAAGMVAGMVDPISLGVGVASGGVGFVARGGMLVKTAVGAAMGAASGAGLDYASQQVFDDPYADPVMAGVIGGAFGALGGALSRNRATSYEADLATTAGALTKRGKLESGASEAILGQQLDSVGAARNTSFRDNLIPSERAYLGEVADDAVGKGFGGGMRFDITGQMTTSDVPLVRLLGMNLFEETAGMVDGGVVPDSVNSMFTSMHRKVIGNFVTEYTPAKAEFMKAAGVGRLNLVGRARVEAEYSRSVSAFVRDPMPVAGVDPSIVKGATAVRKMMNDLRVAARDSGLADIPENPNYLPLVARHGRIAELDAGIHQDVMADFFAQAIKRHTPGITDEIVTRMSKGYWNTIRKAGYGIEDGLTRSLQLGDKDGFKRSFMEAVENRGLLSDDQLDSAYDALSGVMESIEKGAGQASKGVGHFKKRTLMDYNFKATVRGRDGSTRELSVYDLFEDDAEFLTRRYARSLSGRIAFAKMKVMNPSKGELLIDGIRSEGDLDRVKDMVKEAYRLADGDYGAKRSDMENQLKNIDFAWKRINGIPVWDNQNSFNQWARRIKTMQFVRLMSNMGLNQAQEGWKIMALTGFRSALSQLPSIKTMASGVKAGKWDKDKLLTELTDLTGIGLDGLWNKFDLRLDEDRVGQLGGTGFTQKVDAVLDSAQQLTSQISLMRGIHDYQQRWAMKAITQQMVHMARKTGDGAGGFDYSKLKPRDRQRMASIGLGEDDAKLLFRNLMDHSEFDGKKIVGVNVTKWDADAVSKFRTFLGRYTDRLVQQNDFGGLSKWMSQPVASMFIQFRSFVFGAWAKSTLWSMNHGALKDPRMMVMLIGEIAMGAATYAVRQSGQITGEDGWEKWKEEIGNPANLLKGGIARTATASILPMLIDSALLFTPAGPQFGNARSSGSPTDSFFGSPAVDQLTSAARFARGAIGSVMDGEEMTQSEIKSGVRALPLPGNWVPFTAALGALIKDRE
jgi:hypothetical protein